MLVEIFLIGPIICFLFIALGAMTSKTKKRFAPGPTGIPFFGSFFDIDMKNLHLDFMRWKEQYGNIVSFKLNGKNILVLNNAEIIRKAFASDDIGPLMSDRPLNFMGEYIAFGYKDVLLRRYDDEFLRMKDVMIRALTTHDFNSPTFRQMMQEETNHVVTKFQKTEGKPTDAMDILMPSFCNIIGMLVSIIFKYYFMLLSKFVWGKIILYLFMLFGYCFAL
jgi:cytochrome P450